MKKLFTIQICALVLISGSLAGIVTTTTVYDDVQSIIVSVLCLSCIKLDPKTNLEFTFKTANGWDHQKFVIDNLSNGPLFIAYRTDVCEACDIMEPILQDIFDVYFEKEETIIKTVAFENTNVTFIHINLDHASQDLYDSFSVYDKDHIEGVPMFTLITLGYDRGFIKPYYASMYGVLNLDTYEERKELFNSVILDGITEYNRNKEGYDV